MLATGLAEQLTHMAFRQPFCDWNMLEHINVFNLQF